MNFTIDRSKRQLKRRARPYSSVAENTERTLVVIPTTALRPGIANTLARGRVWSDNSLTCARLQSGRHAANARTINFIRPSSRLTPHQFLTSIGTPRYGTLAFAPSLTLTIRPAVLP